jgi:hypothetical protein
MRGHFVKIFLYFAPLFFKAIAAIWRDAGVV